MSTIKKNNIVTKISPTIFSSNKHNHQSRFDEYFSFKSYLIKALNRQNQYNNPCVIYDRLIDNTELVYKNYYYIDKINTLYEQLKNDNKF